MTVVLVTHELHIDLTKYGCQPVVAAVQGEANTRQLSISLFSNRIAWAIPDGATAAVAFLKPDGTRGLYNKLPNGTVATTLSGNTVNAILAPQVLTCAGIVLASVVFYDAEGDTLATFPFQITVEKNPAAGEQISNDYYNPSILDLDAAVKELEKQVEVLKAGGGNTDSGQIVPGATQAQAESLWAIIDTLVSGGAVSAAKITAFRDAWGISDAEAVPTSIEEVPEYFREAVLTASDWINGLGDEWAVSLMLADPHWNSNQLGSIPIINYLLNNSKAERVFVLGDWTDDNTDDQYQIPFDSGIGRYMSRVYWVMGDHDVIGAGEDGHIPAERFRDDFVAPKNVRGNPDTLEYYFDDAACKIRYIIQNCNVRDSAFLTSALAVAPDWSVMILSHHNPAADGTIPAMPNIATGGAPVTRLIRESCPGHIVGWFSGHHHVDSITALDDGFRQVMLAADRYEHTDWYGIGITDKAIGTVTEQVVTLCAINTTTKQVQFRRIGARREPWALAGYTYEMYSVGSELVNAALSHTQAYAEAGASYTTTLMVGEGYTLHRISVAMGGVDITDDAYDADAMTISIGRVTGDITITAYAEADGDTSDGTKWTDGVPYKMAITPDQYLTMDGTVAAYSGWSISDYLCCDGADYLEFDPVIDGRYCAFYDADKHWMGRFAEGSGRIVEVPIDARWFRMSTDSSKMDHMRITPRMVDVESEDNLIDLTGLTIVDSAAAAHTVLSGTSIRVTGGENDYVEMAVNGLTPGAIYAIRARDEQPAAVQMNVYRPSQGGEPVTTRILYSDDIEPGKFKVFVQPADAYGIVLRLYGSGGTFRDICLVELGD